MYGTPSINIILMITVSFSLAYTVILPKKKIALPSYAQHRSTGKPYIPVFQQLKKKKKRFLGLAFYL